jgi:hypothetical protein
MRCRVRKDPTPARGYAQHDRRRVASRYCALSISSVTTDYAQFDVSCLQHSLNVTYQHNPWLCHGLVCGQAFSLPADRFGSLPPAATVCTQLSKDQRSATYQPMAAPWECRDATRDKRAEGPIHSNATLNDVSGLQPILPLSYSIPMALPWACMWSGLQTSIQSG